MARHQMIRIGCDMFLWLYQICGLQCYIEFWHNMWSGDSFLHMFPDLFIFAVKEASVASYLGSSKEGGIQYRNPRFVQIIARFELNQFCFFYYYYYSFFLMYSNFLLEEVKMGGHLGG
jgi:hypothetical protein